MAILSAVTTRSIKVNVTAVPTAFAAAMAAGEWWQFTSTTACWIKQGAAPVASAASGSMYVPPNTVVMLDPLLGADLSVVRDTADGVATMTPCKAY